MRILKFALVVYLLAFYVGLGVFALPSKPGETVPQRDNRNPQPGLVIVSGGDKPTRCLDDWDIEWAWLMCPNGWISDCNGVVCQDLVISDDE